MDTITRLRISLEDRHILKKCQRSEGLKRSWLQLKPSFKTISELSSHIFNTFQLHHSCPYGIILTMDGFVLPPFESTFILKDKDVIRVKRKGKSLSEIIHGEDGENLIDEHEIEERQALLTSVPLLANEEFENESGGYQSEFGEQEEEEDDKDNHSQNDLYEEISPERKRKSKKRKAPKKLGSSKRKKKKLVSEDDFRVDQNMSNGFYHGESSGTKKDVSGVQKEKLKRTRATVSVESDDDNSQPLPSPKRSSPIQEDEVDCDGLTQAPDRTEKKPSRSARRKKAKRHWLREIIKAEKELLLHSDKTCSEVGTSKVQLEKMQSHEADVNNHFVEQQQQNKSCDVDNEISPDTNVVPIVIRPGHIRFEPLEEGELSLFSLSLSQNNCISCLDQSPDSDGETVQKRHFSKEMVEWNGITNKKKGQKWGRENSTSWRDESQGSKNEHSEPMTTEEVKTPNDTIDFNNLAPLSRLPREGDFIAYRLVELSSTWTPELTSFRVGKTSWYDSESNKILLTPLPEYPILVEKQDEEDTFAQPPDNSFYKEDGSLEIEFSALVEVKMVQESDSNPHMSNGNVTHDSTPHSAKQANAWDEINETLSAKKAELMRENSWIKENSSWSCRAMRRSAVGPTMAMLRANNEI